MSLLCSLPVVLASGSFGSSARVQDLAPPEPADLRIKSYNLNYGLAGDPGTLAAVGAGAPDLVLLQETTPAWEAAIRGAYAQDFAELAFIEGPGAGGMGLLSRFPVVSEEILPSPIGWFPAWVLVVQTPQGPLQLLNLHLKPPYAERGGFLVGAFTTGDERLEELDVYLSFLDPGLPTVVLGDFNEQRGPSLALLQGLGFSDALPAGVDTWRWRVAGVQIDAALDHIFGTPDLRVVSVEVQDLGRSDHLPVMVGFVVE